MGGSLNCRGDLVDEVWRAFKILGSPSSRTCSLSSVIIAIRIFSAEVLLKMEVPGQDFVMAPFFVRKIGEDQNKGLRCKISGFSFQKYVKTEKKSLRLKISGFFVQMRMETTKQNAKNKVFTTNRWSYGFTS